VRNDVSVDSETLLVINFVNLKIKLTQSFKYAHKYRMYVHVFIGMSTHTCIRICVYKKKRLHTYDGVKETKHIRAV
jgi:hypothetical protein